MQMAYTHVRVASNYKLCTGADTSVITACVATGF